VWLNYDEAPLFDHWVEYADHYEQHFPKPDGAPVKLLEIGVQSGGSARTWKQYYGSALTYVGIDIEPACMRTASPAEGIFVEIGSQLNTTFLGEVCDRHGPFDAVVDDGGHSGTMMDVSMSTIFQHPNCLSSEAVYTIEDMHTMSMCGAGYCDEPSQVYGIVGRAFGGMHMHWFAEHNNSWQAPSPWAKQVRNIALYDSLAFLTKGAPISRLTRIIRGTDRIPYGSGDSATRDDREPVG